MLVIPAFRRQRQEDQEFKVSRGLLEALLQMTDYLKIVILVMVAHKCTLEVEETDENTKERKELCRKTREEVRL